MKVLAFAASMRRESFNRKLISLAMRIAQEQGASVELVDFREFDMPMYDADLNETQGLPEGALALKRHLESVDAILLAAPEYNYSIAGPLKNAIDWVSRARPMPWRGKSIFLLSASPSPMGGIRGLWQTRIPLEGCGALVFPDMFALSHANKAFTPLGELVDASHGERLRKDLAGFLRLAEAYCRVLGSETPPKAQERRTQITSVLERETSIQPPC